MSWITDKNKVNLYFAAEFLLFIVGNIWLVMFALIILPRNHAIVVCGLMAMIAASRAMGAYRNMLQLKYMQRQLEFAENSISDVK